MIGICVLLAVLGVRTRQVLNLEEEALFVPESKLLFLDSNLTPAEIVGYLEAALAEVWA